MKTKRSQFKEPSEEERKLWIETRQQLKGHAKRTFMAKVVNLLGRGGKAYAKKHLGWNWYSITKGQKELELGIVIQGNPSASGRKSILEKLPHLEADIRAILEPESQVDPTFKTTKCYSPLTASAVRRRLIESGNYTDEQLPTERTISKVLNRLGFSLKKPLKIKPLKK